MMKSGWYVVSAAFFFLLNFLAADVPTAFWQQILLFSFYIALFHLLRRIDLPRLLPPVVAGVSAIVFVYGIIQKFLLFPLYLRQLSGETDVSPYIQTIRGIVEKGRIFSIFTLPTLFAPICGVLLLFILHYICTKHRRLGWVVLFVLGTVNLLLTQSFGGLFYFSAAVLYYLFRNKVLPIRYFAPVVMVLSLFVFLIVGVRYAEARQAQPLRLRLANWNQALRLIAAHPWTGVGLGNYATAVPRSSIPVSLHPSMPTMFRCRRRRSSACPWHWSCSAWLARSQCADAAPSSTPIAPCMVPD